MLSDVFEPPTLRSCLIRRSEDEIGYYTHPQLTIAGAISVLVVVALLGVSIHFREGPLKLEIIIECVWALLIPFFVFMTMPRKLVLNLRARTYVATGGLGIFSRKQLGRLDEVSNVYMRYDVSHGDHIQKTYSVGMTFGRPKKPYPLFSSLRLRLPICDIAIGEADDRDKLWDYANKLATEVGVPCVALFWEPPDRAYEAIE